MFGMDLEEFIKNNICFKNQGGRPNQDIYYNIKENKFWVHKYFGNESLSQNSYKDNICIHKIKNTDDFEFSCTMCYDGDSNDKYGHECADWEECQAHMTYEFIHEHKFDDLYGGNGFYYEIEDKLKNCHYQELAEIDLLLEEKYGDHYEYINKMSNSTLSADICDTLIDEIIENGFWEEPNDNWLDGDCEALRVRYLPDVTDEEIDDELKQVLKLLDENKIVEALEVLE